MNIGIDIGRQYIKYAAIESNKSGTKILSAGERSIMDINQSYDPEKISKPYWVMAIKELLEQNNIKPKRVRNLTTAINGSNVSIKEITTLDMASDELYSAMVFEARKHIPMDGTDAVVDFQIKGQNTKEVDKIDVGLVACTKRILNHHLDVLKEAGLKPGIVEAEATALSNLFVHKIDLPEDGVYVLLNLGAVSSTIIVMGRQAQYFTRDIPIGSHTIVQEIVKRKKIGYLDAVDRFRKEGIESLSGTTADSSESIGVSVAERTIFDNVVEDIRRSLRYYAKSTGNSYFQKIFVTGGWANTNGFADFLQEKLKIDTELFNPFEALESGGESDVENPFQYAVALGLALRGGLHE